MENQLSLNKALLLYETLGEYVPLNWREFNDDSLQFIGTIIDNIKNSNKHQTYFDAIIIMTDATYNTLLSSTPEEVLDLFIRSLVEWRIIELVEFFRELGYDRPS